MSQTKNHCEPLIAVWLTPSTTESCICCKRIAEKPRGEHLEMYKCIDVCYYLKQKKAYILVMIQQKTMQNDAVQDCTIRYDLRQSNALQCGVMQ